MIIGIDARPLTSEMTGIGVYLRCTLQQMALLRPHYRFVLFSGSTIARKGLPDQFQYIEGPGLGRALTTLWYHLVLPVQIRRQGIDCFWGPRHQLPLMLPGHIHTVLTIHDLVQIHYPRTMTLGNLVAERLLVARSAARANSLVTDARTTAADLKRHLPVFRERISSIYPGVPPMHATGVWPSAQPALPQRYFLFVGALDPRKNIQRIFSAFEKVARRHDDLHLIFAGSRGWRNQAFRKKIANHRFAARVHLLGYVDNQALVYLYRHAVGLLFPSLYEGFGFPILEAMAQKTPVITSAIPTLAEVAGRAALKVDPYSVKAIAGAMQKLLVHESLRRQLIARGTEQIQRFSWQECARKLLYLLEKRAVH